MKVLPNVQALRAQFPSLESGFIFLENAGGSQVPAGVANAIRDYMLTNYVQIGAGYEISQRATQIVDEAHEFINEFMNGAGVGQVVLGPSSTQLVTMLAECYERALSRGDEIIIAETGHEANIGPWAKMANKGFTIRTWKVNPETMRSEIEDLKPLLNERTKIVAFVHVSNLLGEIVDVAAITRIAHEAGARVVVDGVAFAPHREIDVKAWDVDWYFYSCYKVFGPHMAALFGKKEAFAELTGPNHFFIPNDSAYKYELGGVSHEGCAGVLALRGYLQLLGGSQSEDHKMVKAAFDAATDLELPLQERLIQFLKSKPKVRIIGPPHAQATRVPTISFVHQTKSAMEIVAEVDRHNIGIRNGHMYAYRLCKALGIDTEIGVVRVSAVHYNTVEEIDRLVAVLDPLL